MGNIQKKKEKIKCFSDHRALIKQLWQWSPDSLCYLNLSSEDVSNVYALRKKYPSLLKKQRRRIVAIQSLNLAWLRNFFYKELTKCYILKVIHLQIFSDSVFSPKLWLQNLKKILQHNKYITELTLCVGKGVFLSDHLMNLFKSIKFARNLKIFALQAKYCEYDFKLFNLLPPVLSKLPNLRKLDVETRKPNHSAIITFTKSLNKSLKNLNLNLPNYQKDQNTSLKLLANSLFKTLFLKHLKLILVDWPLDNEDFYMFSEALQGLKQLTSLQLDFKRLLPDEQFRIPSNEGINELFLAIGTLVNLEELCFKVAYWRNKNFAKLNWALQKLTKIKDLELSFYACRLSGDLLEEQLQILSKQLFLTDIKLNYFGNMTNEELKRKFSILRKSQLKELIIIRGEFSEKYEDWIKNMDKGPGRSKD